MGGNPAMALSVCLSVFLPVSVSASLLMVTVGTLSNIVHFVFLFFLSLDESYESNIVFPRLSLSLSLSQFLFYR